MYVLNPNARNPDVAMAYLEYLCGHRALYDEALLKPASASPVLHPQIEEWIGGGSEFGANLFYLYVRYGIILFILLLVPALNLSGITLSRMRRRMAELGVRRAFGATQGTILWQVLSENMVLTLLGGLLGLAMSYGAMLLLRDWLLVTSLGKTGLSTGMFNGAVFIAAFLFCLVLNLFSAGLPAWRMSRLNITDSING